MSAEEKGRVRRGRRRPAASKEERERRTQQLDVLMDWVTQQLASKTSVPRKHDVVRHAYVELGYRNLTPAEIARRLRLHPAYVMSSSQSRGVRRWKRYRPIITNTLGMLHGDLGYFSVKREYETPVTFRAGYLVLKDVLSRFTYAVILNRTKSADSIVRAFEKILQQHQLQLGDSHPIISVSFDQETSVMSRKVQDFLRERHIAFHAFRYSSSKSKMAEGVIRLIRTKMARLTQQHPNQHWWVLLKDVVDMLNNEEIFVNGQGLGWRPNQVRQDTLRQFRRDLLKADPAQFFGQYAVFPRPVKFKFPVGSIVRPKLIITSSAVVGEKRSEVSVERDYFVVTEHIPYVNARLDVGRAYRCLNPRTQEEEVFDEHDLAASVQ
jgi:hypothetical protein